MPRLRKFLDAYLTHYLRMKEQESQYDLQRRNQSALAGEQNELQLLTKVLEKPALAHALQRGGRREVGRIPIDALLQTREQGMAGMSAEIQKATTREQLPTQIGVERMLGSQPSLNPRDPRDVEAFLPELQEREERLKSLTPPVRVDSVYDQMSGEKQTRFVPGTPEALTGQSFTTAPGPKQAGLDSAAQKVSEYGAPGMAGVRQDEVTQAGLKAGAESQARLPAQIELERIQHMNRLELERQKRDVERTKLPAAAAEKIAGIDAALFSAEKMLMLYQTQGSQIPSQIGPVEGRKMQARQVLPVLSPVDPKFAEFSAEEATLKNNMIKAITGAQMSEPEAVRIMQQVPTSTNKNVDWEARMRATINNLHMLKQKIVQLNTGGVTPEATVQYQVGPDGKLVRIQ